MLDIALYTDDGKSEVVELSEGFCEWLVRSDFYKIGKSEPKTMKIDEEFYEIDVIYLEGSNRRKLSGFLRDEIVQESASLLEQLGDFPTKHFYQAATFKLRKLQEMRRFVEDEGYKYLEIV